MLLSKFISCLTTNLTTLFSVFLVFMNKLAAFTAHCFLNTLTPTLLRSWWSTNRQHFVCPARLSFSLVLTLLSIFLSTFLRNFSPDDLINFTCNYFAFISVYSWTLVSHPTILQVLLQGSHLLSQMPTFIHLKLFVDRHTRCLFIAVCQASRNQLDFSFFGFVFAFHCFIPVRLFLFCIRTANPGQITTESAYTRFWHMMSRDNGTHASCLVN